AFYALIEQKSALFKIFDLKARRFRVIFALSFMQIGYRRSNKNKGKVPKAPVLRRFRIVLVTLEWHEVLGGSPFTRTWIRSPRA
ncbi:MAG: hypothetical protein IJN34_03295, partial [Clostridia bacterium]|nr:hypothetical protein [Clostridia bacterium]